MNKKHRFPLVLHSSEWNRLQEQADKHITVSKCDKEEYLKSMYELSQKWKSNWPDTTEGTVDRVLRERQEKETRRRLKAFGKQKKYDPTEALQKARDLIFERSCYGVQLRGALTQAKAYEEIERQIEFRKKLNTEQAEIDKKLEDKTVYSYVDVTPRQEAEKQRKKREMKINHDTFNRNVAWLRRCKELKEKEEEKALAQNKVNALEKITEKEKIIGEKVDQIFQQELEQYNIDNENLQKHKIKEAEFDDKLVEAWKTYHDRVQCKSNQVLNEMRVGKEKSLKAHYDLVEKLQNDKEKQFNEFVDKGVRRLEQSVQKLDEQEKKKEKEGYLNRVAMAKEYMSVANDVSAAAKPNRCSCDRQSLIIASCYPLARKFTPQDPKNDKSYEFLRPASSLRHPPPPPPAPPAAPGAHALFFTRAKEAMDMCRYKIPVANVVENYRITNGLDNEVGKMLNY